MQSIVSRFDDSVCKGLILKPARQSGIELLRIISMLFVVLMHINSFSNINPCDLNVILNYPAFSFSRFFLESLVIVGVNCFVLISGWFGIKASIKGLLKFVFQVVFLYFVIYLLLVILGLRHLSVSHFFSCLTLGYWFVHAYLILYILSPILNAFVDNSSPRLFRYLLIVFFSYQTIYGWLKPVSESIHMGYSPISFIGLYLLSRYLKLHGCHVANLKTKKLMILCLGCTILNSFASFIMSWTGHGDKVELVYYYCNPLIIIQAISLLLIFSRMTFYSCMVNWVACSCFSVYIFHMHPMVRDYFFDVVSSIWNKTSYSVVTLSFLILVIVIYIVSILIDKVRIRAWQMLTGYCSPDKCSN